MFSRFFSFILIPLTISTPAVAHDTPYIWTGAYVGFNIGAAWFSSHLRANDVNFLNASHGSYNQKMRDTSAFPGLQAGYLKQFKQKWILGAEGDFTYPNSHTQFSLISQLNSAFDKFNVNNKVQGSLRVRAGPTVARFFPFVSTGISFGGMNLKYSNERANNYSKDTTQVGYVVGLGLECSLLKNVSGRIEYLYTGYGNLKMQIPSIDNVNIPGSTSANSHTNVLRAAFNYFF